jgi:DNA-binding NtrC family response regulator
MPGNWRSGTAKAAIGHLGRVDRELQRQALVEAIWQCEGNLLRVAHQLGMCRTPLARQIVRHRLYPEIDAAREVRRARVRKRLTPV